MGRSYRQFDANRFEKMMSPELRPKFGVGSTVYTAEILVPTAEVSEDQTHRVATRRELREITHLLCQAFGGVTRSHPKRGLWISTKRPFKIGRNTHAVFEIVAAPTDRSLEFLRILKRELERHLGEDVIFMRLSSVTML